MPSGKITLKVSRASAELLGETHERTGALVVGRRHFDLARGWGGRHPMDLPVFVVTHCVSREWVYEGFPFTFVTDGVEEAVERARAVAGDKDVGVGGANVAQQPSEQASSTRWAWTWCPSCSEGASGPSTASAPGRSS